MTLREEAVKGAVAGAAAGAVIGLTVGIAGFLLVNYAMQQIGGIFGFRAVAAPTEITKGIYID